MDSATDLPFVHKNEQTCQYILANIDAPTGWLGIRESSIPTAGSGLFITVDVAEGRDVFSSKPILTCAKKVAPNLDNEASQASSLLTCDFCFQSNQNLFEQYGYLFPSHPTRPIPEFCVGCHVCQYCSKVCWLVGGL